MLKIYNKKKIKKKQLIINNKIINKWKYIIKYYKVIALI